MLFHPKLSLEQVLLLGISTRAACRNTFQAILTVGISFYKPFFTVKPYCKTLQLSITYDIFKPGARRPQAGARLVS